MKVRHQQLGKITFRSMMPKLRWLWTFILLIYVVMVPLLFSEVHQVSADLSSRQTATVQPIIGQLGTLILLSELFFGFSVVLALIAWGLWIPEKFKTGKTNSIP
ncbi:MAG: hypothetical protein ACRYFS_05455 [Janthinobacterium lividum]